MGEICISGGNFNDEEAADPRVFFYFLNVRLGLLVICFKQRPWKANRVRQVNKHKKTDRLIFLCPPPPPKKNIKKKKSGRGKNKIRVSFRREQIKEKPSCGSSVQQQQQQKNELIKEGEGEEEEKPQVHRVKPRRARHRSDGFIIVGRWEGRNGWPK